MKRSYRWFVMFPQDAYALGPVQFETLVGENKVREWARSWEGIKRLPNGWKCWPA